MQLLISTTAFAYEGTIDLGPGIYLLFDRVSDEHSLDEDHFSSVALQHVRATQHNGQIEAQHMRMRARALLFIVAGVLAELVGIAYIAGRNILA